MTRPPVWKSVLIHVGGTTKFCEVEGCHNLVGREHDYCPQEHRSLRPDYPRCGCGLPAVCFGADLVAPKWRCPRCCHRDHRTQHHGPVDYLDGHETAEGLA